MDWLKKWMTSRYGVDQLSMALLAFTVLLSLIISLMTYRLHIPFLSFLIYIPLIICYYRVFSKNIAKRQQENFRFLHYWYPIKNKLQKKLNRLKGMKTHRYYKCPHCSKALRVPKGKGRICITCPHCKHEFSKKS